MRKVAALYIDERGPYMKLPDVDAWGESRDAKKYDGPFPVVAHPPCGPWGRLRHFSKNQDPSCGPRAVEQVQRWGGVLEHPKDSRLWQHCALPPPGWLFEDEHGGRTYEISQVDWGHVARKKTWIYVVRARLPEMPSTGAKPTHWISGVRWANMMREKNPATRGYVPNGIKVCSAEQGRRTPPAFRDFLLAIARSVLPSEHDPRHGSTDDPAPATDGSAADERADGAHADRDASAGSSRADGPVERVEPDDDPSAGDAGASGVRRRRSSRRSVATDGG